MYTSVWDEPENITVVFEDVFIYLLLYTPFCFVSLSTK